MAKRKSLKTYLKQYCKEICETKDYRLSSFVEGLKNNPRCEGPVLLYAALYLPQETWILDMLNKKEKNNYLKTIECLKSFKDMNTLVGRLPIEEDKALLSYFDYINENKSDNSLKRAYRERIIALIKIKGISYYRICKDNSTNNGNFHAFIKGAYDKLSTENCEQIYNYLL